MNGCFPGLNTTFLLKIPAILAIPLEFPPVCANFVESVCVFHLCVGGGLNAGRQCSFAVNDACHNWVELVDSMVALCGMVRAALCGEVRVCSSMRTLWRA